MFELFRNWFRPAGRDEGDDREGLRRAVAALVYEVTRMDFEVRPEDLATARAALGDLLEITDGEAHDLLQHAGDAGNRLTVSPGGSGDQQGVFNLFRVQFPAACGVR